MSPEKALALRRRGEAGDAEAMAFAGVLAALGAWEPQSWETATARLARAAELGSDFARRQLAVLSGREAGAPDELAAAIDWAAWLAPAPKTRRLDDPRIATAKAFLSPGACAWMIERARGRVAQALVFDAASGGRAVEAGRSNSAFEFAFEDLDLVTVAIRARIAANVAVPPGALETIQVLHYAPGQRFDRHFDFLDPATPGFAAEIERSGQRIATFLVYLNGGFEGGETEFPLLDVRYKGQTGDALMFSNVDAAGAPDRRTLHAGLPPMSGEKWLLSQWIRDRARA